MIMPTTCKGYLSCIAIASAMLPGIAAIAFSADTSQLGFTSSRNNVAPPSDIPPSWTQSKRVKWCQRIGTQTNASPVVAAEKVLIGTNNGGGYQPRYAKEMDRGVLLCLDKRSGDLLWQYSSAKLPTGKIHDWPEIGICSTPLVEGNRMWFVSNRGEVVCLDVEGSTNEQPDHTGFAAPSAGIRDAEVLWQVDMMQQFGVQQHNMANCSVTAADSVLLVCTSNGVDRSHQKVAAPLAPSFLALDKTTGILIWSDRRPGENILHGQWSSPSVAEIGGRTQAIFAGGDGWLYSFDPAADRRGGAKLLWKFDCNPKLSVWSDGAELPRNNIISMPVIHGHHVYVATGQSPDRGEGAGRVWCIDAAKRLDGSDVSDELALAADGQPLAPRRTQAVDRNQGEFVRLNPITAGVWCYTGGDVDGDGKISHFEQMHRSVGNIAVHNDLAIAVDATGVIHCLDANTGQPYWTHDTLSEVWASPLIVGDRLIVADLGGMVSVFRLAKDPQRAMRPVGGQLAPLTRWDLGGAIHSTPTVSQGVLFVATQTELWALELSQLQKHESKTSSRQ
jgi:outer membrane protein assembly factor BamB